MIVDFILTIYAFIGAIRGRKQEISLLLYRFTRNFIATISGLSIFTWVARFFSGFLSNFFSDIAVFSLAFVLAILVVCKFKRKFIFQIEKLVGKGTQSQWGRLLGLCSHLIIGSAIIFSICISGEGFLHNYVTKHSFLGKLYGYLTAI